MILKKGVACDANRYNQRHAGAVLHPLLYEKARLLLHMVIKASLLLRKEK